MSKRETVTGFHGAQRDLDHSAHIRVPIRICLGTKILLASLDETKHAGNRGKFPHCDCGKEPMNVPLDCELILPETARETIRSSASGKTEVDMRVPMWRTFSLALIAFAAIAVGGCGGGDSTTTVTESEETPANVNGAAGSTGGKTVEIKMGDYFFSPEDVTAQAGSTTIEAPNEGSVEHELVVFKTNLDPSKLPTESNGGVDEEKLDEIAGEAGEVADVEAGETKSEGFKLTPGKYVIFCNLPGHYAQGMYGTLTVE